MATFPSSLLGICTIITTLALASAGPLAQEAYVKASNTTGGASFGGSVAISGDTLVIGSINEDTSDLNSGAAYVFVRNAGVWTEQALLKASNTGIGDNFGVSVAIFGDTIFVGATHEDSGTTGVNSVPDESATDAGAAYVFVRNAGIWTQQAYLKASNTGAGDLFGSVSISGDTIVIGARNEDSGTTGVNSTPNESASNAGAAYVFVRNAGVWTQQAYLKPGNTGSGDLFGTPSAISGDTIVVGARSEDSSTTGVNSTPNEGASNAGAAYVFVRNAGVWTQQAYLKASNTGMGDDFGGVAISGDTIVVGALLEDSGASGVNSVPNEAAAESGAAYVFVRNAGTWTQQAYLKASNPDSQDRFGIVSISGDAIVVGAPLESSSTTGVNSVPNNAFLNAGAAYVFTRVGGLWSQQAYLKASNTDSNDVFASTAISGDTIVVGASGEDSSTTGINSVPNEFSLSSGAAYVFSGLSISPPGLEVSTLPSGAAQFSFTAPTGSVLRLERASLLPNAWSTHSAVTIPSAGNLLWTDPSPPNPRGFYRVWPTP